MSFDVVAEPADGHELLSRLLEAAFRSAEAGSPRTLADHEPIAVTPASRTPTNSGGLRGFGEMSKSTEPLTARILATHRARTESREAAPKKLAAVVVQQIRDNARTGWTQRALALHFGLSQSTISDVVAGRSHAHVPDEPASALRPATLEAAHEHVTIEGVPYRERLFALLSDPTATLADLEAALGAVPGVKVHPLVPVHRQGWGRDAASVLCESVLVTSPRGALEVTRTTDSYGRTQWSAPWVGPSVAELPRVGPQGVLARLSCLEVQP